MTYTIIIRSDEKSSKLKEYLIKQIKHTYVDSNPDIVIAIGGDGTILKAAHSYPLATIFGIHTGHLGFYANYNIDTIDEVINSINSGDYKIDELPLLSCKIISKSNEIYSNALNEITIVTPPRTLRLDVFIDNEFLERFRGTGFCISTPSGSTAYNKSLHGSVVDSSVKCIQITEIAGINSNAYRTLSSPLILNQDRFVRFDAVNEIEDVFITVDHISYKVSDFKSLEIFNDNKKLKLAYNKHESFIKRINRTFLISLD